MKSFRIGPKVMHSNALGAEQTVKPLPTPRGRTAPAKAQSGRAVALSAATLERTEVSSDLDAQGEDFAPFCLRGGPRAVQVQDTLR